jgi:hypothetical protein
MQIEMADVETHIARPRVAQRRVQVSSIVVKQSAPIVNPAGQRQDLFLEQAIGGSD